MRNAFFNVEDMGFAPAVPTAEFGAGEEEGYKEEEEGGVAPAGAAAGVGRFNFRCAQGGLARSQRWEGMQVQSSENGIKEEDHNSRKASKVLNPSESPLFSPNAPSSSP